MIGIVLAVFVWLPKEGTSYNYPLENFNPAKACAAAKSAGGELWSVMAAFSNINPVIPDASGIDKKGGIYRKKYDCVWTPPAGDIIVEEPKEGAK